MEDLMTKIQYKKIKLENALIDLNNEISTLFKFLKRLKSHSTDIVGNLNNLNMPEIYLQEYMDVNSFIFKYLSFLTEINCKFEMLELAVNRTKTLTLASDSIVHSEMSFGVTDKSDSQPDLSESLMHNRYIKFTESFKEATKELYCQTDVSLSNILSESQDCRRIKSEVTEYGEEIKSGIPEITYTKVDTQDSYKSTSLSLFPEVEISNFDAETHKPDESSISLNRKLPDPTMKSEFKSNNAECIKIEREQATSSFFDLFDLSYVSKDKEVKTKESKIPLRNTDVQIAEVAPTKITEYNKDLKIGRDAESPQRADQSSSDVFDLSEIKNRNFEACEISPRTISRAVGEEYEVTLEHIESPSEFYVQIQNSQLPLFLELMMKLKHYSAIGFQKNKLSKAELSIQLGIYVLFFAKCDETWCRAKVVNWCIEYDDDLIKIFLLDYGEYKCVSINDIDVMPESFKKYPIFSTRCHLHGILPPDFDRNGEIISWSNYSTEKMICLTETSRKMKIKIAPKDKYHPEYSLPVTLWLPNEQAASVNELLVRCKYAVYGSQNNFATVKTEVTNEDHSENDNFSDWNPMKEDFESYENCYDLDVNDPASYIYGYVGKDYENICQHFARTGYCYKGDACKKEHQALDSLGFTKDVEEVYRSAFYSLSLPQPKSFARIQVTSLFNINKFCCIIDDQRHSQEDENLDTLLASMNKPENVQIMKKLLVPPSAGQIVIAQFSQDSSWYRAKIIESQPENDAYAVLYVDYGNRETLPLSSIRAIEARHLHLPFQAVQCYIFGIRQNPEKSLKESMDYLNKKILKGNLTIQVVSKLPGEIINLMVNVFDEEGESIGEDLIAKKYAVPQTEVMVSNDSKSVPG